MKIRSSVFELLHVDRHPEAESPEADKELGLRTVCRSPKDHHRHFIAVKTSYRKKPITDKCN